MRSQQTITEKAVWKKEDLEPLLPCINHREKLQPYAKIRDTHTEAERSIARDYV